jgi:RNA polymerase sigma-70 factor, ECF subfamily
MLLTPDQRQAIILKYLEDWENNAIAQAMNKPVGAVKALQHRGLEALRRILNRTEDMDL